SPKRRNCCINGSLSAIRDNRRHRQLTPVKPDRRLAPRPFPVHLASAMTLWLSSRAGLASLSAGLPLWNGADDRLRAFARALDPQEIDKLSTALDRTVVQRAGAFLRGVEAYRQHPYRRPANATRVLWQEGTTRLLDYSRSREGPAILVVPSLINRYYVL